MLPSILVLLLPRRCSAGPLHILRELGALVSEPGVWDVWSPVMHDALPEPEGNACRLVEVSGIQMCVHNSSNYISNTLASTGRWKECSPLIEQASSHGTLILELGGNIGACSVQLLLRTNKVLIIFEPNPSNLFYLTNTLKRMQSSRPELARRAFVYPIGIGDKPIQSVIVEAIGNSGDSTVGRLPKREGHMWPHAGAVYNITIRPLDAIFPHGLAPEAVSLMKLDVQGTHD